MFKKLISFFTKHSAHASTFLFFAGFLFDSIMLPDLEDPIARYIGLGYLCIIAFLIAFRELIVASNKATKTEQKLYSLATFGVAYCSGSALSFVFIYAIRSAALSVSWPLFLIFIICILANEFVSTHNFRLTLDIGILFVAMLFFTVFNVPLLLKQQNDMTFAISVLITVVISILYITCLQFTSEGAKEETGRGYALSVGIPMFFGMLYFLNVIPAVPLSLKEGGVYHSVVHTEAKEFIAKEEIDTRSFSKYRTPV